MLEAMNVAIFIGSALIVAAVFTSLISFRFGAPLLLVFLLVGLLAGEDGIAGIEFDNARAAYLIGSIALFIILFEAGFETRVATLRVAAAPAVVLATAGVVLTAVLVAGAARLFLDLSWIEGLLLGAIVAPTDAAAVFFLLHVGGITLRDRVRSTLEIESGANDPLAIILTLSLIGFMTGTSTTGHLALDLVGEALVELALGGILGVLGGYVVIQAVNRTSLEPALYPIVVLALALVTATVTNLLGGSGFLAVYVAGLVAGNARIRHALSLRRFQAGTTWFAQIAMFVTLGLLATPSQFTAVFAPAVALAAFLTFVARPLAIWLCLLPFGFTRHEIAFIAWVGLRGAVSILLAILPIIGGIGSAPILFNTAFIVVLVSLLVQGWTIRPVARFLGMIVPTRHGPVSRIELELPGRGEHEIVAYDVHPESAIAHGQRIPRWARPSLVIRDGRSMRPHNFGRPQPGDQIYIITTPRYLPLLDRLFSTPTEAAIDPRLYGEFAIEPDAALADVAATYGARVPDGAVGLTVRDYLRRELAGDIEESDRVTLGPVDLIVRGVDENHEITEVGLAVEHAITTRPRIPLFQTRKEIANYLRWLARRVGGRKGLRRKSAPAVSEVPPPSKTSPQGPDQLVDLGAGVEGIADDAGPVDPAAGGRL